CVAPVCRALRSRGGARAGFGGRPGRTFWRESGQGVARSRGYASREAPAICRRASAESRGEDSLPHVVLHFPWHLHSCPGSGGDSDHGYVSENGGRVVTGRV